MATLRELFRPGGEPAKDEGWGKLKEMIRDGRKVSREERTRWQENRCFYRGDQNVYYAPDERTLKYQGTRHDPFNAYNRLRQFTDSRVALLTKERPAYEVIPEDRDADSIDAAKQAEKFVAARWGHTGWNVRSRLYELCANGDIDGIAWLAVQWDPTAAESRDALVAIDNETGEPVTDRQRYEALKAEDPEAQTLWRMERSSKPLGDVRWRVVLPGAISVDPFAVRNFQDAKWVCESRIRPRDEVEKRLGMSYKDAVAEAGRSHNGSRMDPQFEELATDDGTGGKQGSVNEKNGVVVHYFYALPCHHFPKGLYAEFCDKVPGKPLVLEPYEESSLPYFPYIPRPDTGHFLSSRGIVDDLKPIQRDFNRRLKYLDEWMTRVARNPVALPFGSMASDSYYNEDGVFFYHAAMGEPHHSQVPSEPTAVLTNNLAWMTAEMERISGVSQLAQGFTSPGGPEAAVGINLQIQQTEQNLSEPEANLTEAIEWGVQRSLKLVERHYEVARAVTGLGVDDSEEFRAFQGAMLRGAHRFRVTSPLMPKSKAARISTITQLLPYLGDKVVPYLAGLIDGDPTELQRDIEIDRQKQKTETRDLLGLVKDLTAQRVYENFESDKKAYIEALNKAGQMGTPDPQALLAQMGITPPNLTQSMQMAGIDIPIVEDFNNHALELKALDEFRKSDGYRRISEMGKQLLREHADAHKQGMAQQVSAMAQQQPVGSAQGSQPKEVGTPSPPTGGGMQAPGGMPR